MNLPTALTIFRLIASTFFLPLIVYYALPYKCLAFNLSILGFFLLVSITDFFDGYLARKYKQETLLGQLLDPLADKFLICFMLITLVALDKLYFYIAILFIGRELFLMGLREIALAQQVMIKVSNLAKYKTFAQILFIAVLLLDTKLYQLERICIFIALTLSLYSAWDYYKKYTDNVL